jgi:hypothetical protein
VSEGALTILANAMIQIPGISDGGDGHTALT